jgi:hypothetical protein
MPPPTNFLAPNLSDYTNVTVCIFQGTDFPRSRFGERSTYVVVHLHPQLPVIKSPICFNRTNDAVYNGGFDLNCIGIDFSSVVPVIEVFDFISEDQSELIGLGYIQYHLARRVDDVCVVLQDEWVGVVTVNTRIHCGKVKMSLIFHDQDRDVADLVRVPRADSHSAAPGAAAGAAPAAPARRPARAGEEQPAVALESMAVQAEVEPTYQRVSCDDTTGQIGELNLTFSSPMKPWKPLMPVEVIRMAQPVARLPARRAIQFADENDLDEDDEIVPRRKPVPEVSSASQPRAIPKLYQAKTPLRPVNQEVAPEPEKEKGKTPMKKRFARYSDFNWY